MIATRAKANTSWRIACSKSLNDTGSSRVAQSSANVDTAAACVCSRCRSAVAVSGSSSSGFHFTRLR
jgi:hypothetical protein